MASVHSFIFIIHLFILLLFFTYLLYNKLLFILYCYLLLDLFKIFHREPHDFEYTSTIYKMNY